MRIKPHVSGGMGFGTRTTYFDLAPGFAFLEVTRFLLEFFFLGEPPVPSVERDPKYRKDASRATYGANQKLFPLSVAI